MIEVGQKFPGSGAKALLAARPTMMRIQLIDAALWHFQAAVIAAGVALPKASDAWAAQLDPVAVTHTDPRGGTRTVRHAARAAVELTMRRRVSVSSR